MNQVLSHRRSLKIHGEVVPVWDLECTKQKEIESRTNRVLDETATLEVRLFTKDGDLLKTLTEWVVLQKVEGCQINYEMSDGDSRFLVCDGPIREVALSTRKDEQEFETLLDISLRIIIEGKMVWHQR